MLFIKLNFADCKNIVDYSTKLLDLIYDGNYLYLWPSLSVHQKYYEYDYRFSSFDEKLLNLCNMITIIKTELSKCEENKKYLYLSKTISLFYNVPTNLHTFYDTIMEIYNTHELYKSNVHVNKFINVFRKYYYFYIGFIINKIRIHNDIIECIILYMKKLVPYYFYAYDCLLSYDKINQKTYSNLIFYKKIYQTIIKKLDEFKLNKIKFMKMKYEKLLKDYDFIIEEFDVNIKLLNSISNISVKTNKYDLSFEHICNTLNDLTIKKHKLIISTRFDLILYDISYNFDITINKNIMFIDGKSESHIYNIQRAIKFDKLKYIFKLTDMYMSHI